MKTASEILAEIDSMIRDIDVYGAFGTKAECLLDLRKFILSDECEHNWADSDTDKDGYYQSECQKCHLLSSMKRRCNHTWIPGDDFQPYHNQCSKCGVMK